MSFIPNPDAADELCSSDEAMAYVDALAKEAANLTREFMPVNDGSNRDAVVQGGTTVEGDSATSYYGSKSPVWHLVEFGSVNNPPYRPFRRAAEALGLRWEDDG